MKGRLKVAVIATLLLALGVFSLAGCSGTSSSTTDSGNDGTQTKDPYVIGAVLSLTGTYAGLGEPEKNTIDMEVARINEAGGINGHPIKVVYADDGTDPAKAVAAATRLIDQEKVIAIIGATGTGQTMGMRTEVDRAALPQVSIAGGTVITSDFDPLVFQTPWSNSIVVPFTLEYSRSRESRRSRSSATLAGLARMARRFSRPRLPKPESRSSPNRRSIPVTPT